MCVNRIPEAYEENRPCSRVLKSLCRQQQIFGRRFRAVSAIKVA
jgi:hypothetical protein